MGGMSLYANFMTLKAIYKNKRHNDKSEAEKPTRTVRQMIKIIFGDNLILMCLPILRNDVKY
jgi:hypothetical protein